MDLAKYQQYATYLGQVAAALDADVKTRLAGGAGLTADQLTPTLKAVQNVGVELQ